MIAAWREIGKMCGYYAPDRLKVDVKSEVLVEMRRMEQMRYAELINLINF